MVYMQDTENKFTTIFIVDLKLADTINYLMEHLLVIKLLRGEVKAKIPDKIYMDLDP